MHLKQHLYLIILSTYLVSCSVSKQISKSANENVLTNKALTNSHVGLSIFEPSTNKYWFNHQGDKYFVPASNTKIPTCYAAMKYLGDSLVGLRYGIPEEKGWSEHNLVIDATGDPTLWHEDYRNHPVFSFLQNTIKGERKTFGLLLKPNKVERWGSGWSWNDYEEYYMAERSTMPILGNVLSVSVLDSSLRYYKGEYPVVRKYRLFRTGIRYFDSLLNDTRPPLLNSVEKGKEMYPKIRINRDIGNNYFHVEKSNTAFKNQVIPFVTFDFSTTIKVLTDTLKANFGLAEKNGRPDEYNWLGDDGDIGMFHIKKWNPVYSQPTDSLLKPMMHRSDNFFAEQSLIMVSDRLLGYMDDGRIRDSLLNSDFKDLPHKPRWADGSGLSRYNLFTPQDFVAILNKMKNEFGMERLKVILPTGGEGTISSYYKADSNYIFGKTGTLSGVVAFSGFLYTKKGRLLIFSTLVNNHQASATDVRRAIEKFLQGVRNKY